MTSPRNYHELQSVSFDHYREEGMRRHHPVCNNDEEDGRRSPLGPGLTVTTRSMRNDVNRVFKTSRSRAPREMTSKRMGKIEKFFMRIVSQPRKNPYGDIGSKLWIRELISFMNEPRNHKIIPSDVTFWIRTSPQFFEKSLKAAIKQKRTNGSASSSAASSPQSDLSSKTIPSDSGQGSAGDSCGPTTANRVGKENQAPFEAAGDNMEGEGIRDWYPQNGFLSKTTTPSNLNVPAGQSLLTEVKREEDQNSNYFCHLDPEENMFMSSSPPDNVLLEEMKHEPIPTTSSASDQQIPQAPIGFVAVDPNPGNGLMPYFAPPKPMFNFYVTPEKPLDDPTLTYTFSEVPADLARFIMNVDFVGDVTAGLSQWVANGVIPPNLESVQLLTNMLSSLLEKVRAAGGYPTHTVDGCVHAIRCLEAFLAPHNLQK